MNPLSLNTQAILLLTAPLLLGRGKPAVNPITPAVYKRLARALRERNRQPSDLLGPEADAICEELATALGPKVDAERLQALLGRGFQLSQAMERWQSRAIWVLSRADAAYPRRLKARLRDDAPAILYGCGDATLLESGGLAVVGSREVDEKILAYTRDAGALAAQAQRTLVSGGARGVDQAAMNAALDAGGRAVGVLFKELASSAVRREERDLLLDGRLVLISPFDPEAGFTIGNAMARNKLIYALADAALVVNSDAGKGGTWTGAIEQLQKHRFVPVYVRPVTAHNPGLQGLQQAGALLWPEPSTDSALAELLDTPFEPEAAPSKPKAQHAPAPSQSPPDSGSDDAAKRAPTHPQPSSTEAPAPPPKPASDLTAGADPAETLFATVRNLITGMDAPRSDAEVADALNVSKAQARQWLARLVSEGIVEKTTRPVRYRSISAQRTQDSLFG